MRAMSQNPASFMWLRSIRIPSSAQRPTSAAPAAVRPGPMSGVPGVIRGTPWANAFERLQTGPSERRPAAYQSSSASSSGSIASAPSRCSTATGGPASTAAASTSAMARASRRAPWRSSASRRPAAAVASAAAVAWSSSGCAGIPPGAWATPSGRAGEGVKIAKIAPLIPAARIRGRSRWPPSRPLAKAPWSSLVRASLCPSKTAITGSS